MGRPELEKHRRRVPDQIHCRRNVFCVGLARLPFVRARVTAASTSPHPPTHLCVRARRAAARLFLSRRARLVFFPSCCVSAHTHTHTHAHHVHRHPGQAAARGGGPRGDGACGGRGAGRAGSRGGRPWEMRLSLGFQTRCLPRACGQPTPTRVSRPRDSWAWGGGEEGEVFTPHAPPLTHTLKQPPSVPTPPHLHRSSSKQGKPTAATWRRRRTTGTCS